jgi:hypothetical protein
MQIFVASSFPRDEAFLLEEEGYQIEFLDVVPRPPSDERALVSALDALHTFSCVVCDDAWALQLFLQEAKRLKPKALLTLGFSSQNLRCQRTISALGLHLIHHRELESLADSDLALVLKTQGGELDWMHEFAVQQVELNFTIPEPTQWPQSGILLIDSIYLAEESVARKSELIPVALSAKMAAHLESLNVASIKTVKLRTPEALIEAIGVPAGSG